MFNHKRFTRVIFFCFFFNILFACATAGRRLTAAPEVDCKNEKKMKSIESKIKKIIIFKNTTKDSVKLYWLDTEGQRTLYATLPVDTQLDQPTYVTHPWLVTNEAGECIHILPNETEENEFFQILKR